MHFLSRINFGDFLHDIFHLVKQTIYIYIVLAQAQHNTAVIHMHFGFTHLFNKVFYAFIMFLYS